MERGAHKHKWSAKAFDKSVQELLNSFAFYSKLQVQEQSALTQGLVKGRPPVPTRILPASFLQQCRLPPAQTKAFNCLDMREPFEDDWRWVVGTFEPHVGNDLS